MKFVVILNKMHATLDEKTTLCGVELSSYVEKKEKVVCLKCKKVLEDIQKK